MKIMDILAFLQEKQIPFTFSGDHQKYLEWFSSINHYKPGTFTWIKSQRNIPPEYAPQRITLAFVQEAVNAGPIPNIIQTPESKRAFFSTIEHFYGQEEERPAIGRFTYISPKVKLGKNVRIGHNCTLDGDIIVDDGTVIWNHVTVLNRVYIGKHCDIHSGVVIGHDGFAYTEDATGRKTMVKHFGGVWIGNHVLIGENACVSRGTIEDTILANGVKIDSLSHIAHNCNLEEGAAMAGPCRASGSVHIGKNAYLAGSIIRNQCTVGERAFTGVGAVVVQDVASGETVVGNPAKPFFRKKESSHGIH